MKIRAIGPEGTKGNSDRSEYLEKSRVDHR